MSQHTIILECVYRTYYFDHCPKIFIAVVVEPLSCTCRVYIVHNTICVIQTTSYFLFYCWLTIDFLTVVCISLAPYFRQIDTKSAKDHFAVS